MISESSATQNSYLAQWVNEMEELCQPDQVYWCDGSEEEYQSLIQKALQSGELIELNQDKMPGCYLHRSAHNDVARVEGLTYICTEKEEDAGPTNHWMDPKQAYALGRDIFKGAMKGRTMYVIPFCMGPLNSPFSQLGVELTDSIYVVLNMRIMTRMGTESLRMFGEKQSFTRGLHSKADLNVNRRYILHFPEDNAIWSVGSGYGGNALLGKKCMALRIGSYQGRMQKWMAEHMLILGIEHPGGHVDYVVAAFPSACGKTNLAMIVPPQGLKHKGYKIWTVGDDIAWLRIGADGRLYAVNPENGFFGVLPGTNSKTNPIAMQTMSKNTIFTNVLFKKDQTVWWEGCDGPTPSEGIDWMGHRWTKHSKNPGAHPNSRFTAPLLQCPTVSKKVNDPEGVPISAIIFGGRRSTTTPLVYQADSWAHGVYMGATMTSERTAAQVGKIGELRHDPMAMLPFCGYNMGDYFAHWLEMGTLMKNPPPIFHVNWFRQDQGGRYLWPGFGENMRVLEWILLRANNKVAGQTTAIGVVPNIDELDLTGLSIAEKDLQTLLTVSEQEWRSELDYQQSFLEQFGKHLPQELWQQHQRIKKNLE